MYRLPICLLILLAYTQVGAQTEAPDSLTALRDAVAQAPKNGAAWIRLGKAYLDADSIDQAESAFKKAIQFAESAEAHNGLGRVYMAMGFREARKAYPEFRAAIRIDPTFIEAQLNIARTHTLLRSPDAERAYREVMIMDSTYAPVYLELAQWYLDRGYEGYRDELMPLFQKYIEMNPEDDEGHYGLALTYTEHKEYDGVLEVASAALKLYGLEPRWLVLIAQAYAARGEPEKALTLFVKYLGMIEPEERALYEDISLVAFPDEVRVYQAMTMEERRVFLETFWRKRDLVQLTGGAARRVEHYRRVWYAQTFFGKTAHPWDRRGEVYIRYGEPDYRSRSNYPNKMPSLAVENVKDMIVADIGGEAPFLTVPRGNPEAFFSGGGGGQWGSEQKADAGGRSARGVAQPGAGPAYPVLAEPYGPPREVPWESWIYINIDGGTEFVFRDEYINHNYIFPPMPDNSIQLSFYHPQIILDRLSGHTPEKFDIPSGVEPLAFYYDVAQFRGRNGETAMEVYLGIAPEEVSIADGAGDVVRSVTVARPDGAPVFQSREDFRFGGIDTSRLVPGTFVPEVVLADLEPGRYRLAVKLVDKPTGKWGGYLQELEVPAFGDSLAMSDLELAFEIADRPRDRRFKKGDVWVVPMPSRHYRRDQNPSVYYEVYNLTRDEFGQTRYRIEYTIQQDIRNGAGLFGAIGAGFKRLISSGKPQVVVSYEREGRDLWEPIYLELDVAEAKSGLNQIAVRVTDLVSGQVVEKRAMFQLSDGVR